MTYLGPHWSTFAMQQHAQQTLRWFVETLMQEGSVDLTPSAEWTDDPWLKDQAHRRVLRTDGWWVLNSGEAVGRVVGGNLCTLNLLQGTPWMPSLEDAVLVVEDDYESHSDSFARDLTSLMQQPLAGTIRALVIGRFQRASRVTRAAVEALVAAAGVPRGIPVLANVDVGHTSPMATIPIGGQTVVRAELGCPRLTLTWH